MKRWKCSVCGYIYTGDEPPNMCPVCGADQSQFKLIEERMPASSTSPPSPAGVAGRWRCKICSYPHVGSSAPDSCPVCGSLSEHFEPQAPAEPEPASPVAAQPASEPGAAAPIEAMATAPAKTDTPPQVEPGNPWRKHYEQIAERMADLHAHPIAVHIPNGVLPVAVLFLLWAVLFNSPSLEKAAFYNLIFVALSMPIVLFTGYNDWQRRFRGAMTKVFLTKIICGGIIAVGSLILVVWRALNPALMQQPGSGKGFYVLLHVCLLVAGGIAGYQGGKLVVFPDLRKK